MQKLENSVKKSQPEEEDRNFSFGWEVEKRPIFFDTDSHALPVMGSLYMGIPISDRYALVRNDNLDCLSIVSNRYCPFYNHRFEGIVNSYFGVASFKMSTILIF